MNTKIILLLSAALVCLPLPALAAGNAYSGSPQFTGRSIHGRHHGFGQAIREKIRAHRQQQKSENQAFHKSLRSMDPSQRIPAMINHSNQQYTENQTFYQQLHEQVTADVQSRFSKGRLPSNIQQEILTHLNEQYQDAQAFREKEHNETIAFLQSLSSDTSGKSNDNRSRFKAQRQQQKQEIQSWRQARQQNNKTFRAQIRSEIQQYRATQHQGAVQGQPSSVTGQN